MYDCEESATRTGESQRDHYAVTGTPAAGGADGFGLGVGGSVDASFLGGSVDASFLKICVGWHAEPSFPAGKRCLLPGCRLLLSVHR